MQTESSRPHHSRSDGQRVKPPIQRRRLWVELPGWVTAYIRERTEIAKKDTTNSIVFELLCKLWNVPNGFASSIETDRSASDGRRIDRLMMTRNQQVIDLEEDNQETRRVIVYTLTESVGLNTRAANLVTTNDPTNLIQDFNLVPEFVEIIEFIAQNLSAENRRIGWKNSSLLIDSLLHRHPPSVSSQDWMVFPLPDFILWSSTDVELQRFLRHLSIPGPSTTTQTLTPLPHPRIALFGRLLHPPSHQRLSSARLMQLSEIWNHGFFVTMTSKAVASDLAGLKEFIVRLIRRRYETLRVMDSSRPRYELVTWLSLKTYWRLSPHSTNPRIYDYHRTEISPSGSESRVRDDPRRSNSERMMIDRIRSLRAYNLLHDPDLEEHSIAILSRDRLEPAIRKILADPNQDSIDQTSVHLRTQGVLDPLKTRLSSTKKIDDPGRSSWSSSSDLTDDLIGLTRSQPPRDHRHHHHLDRSGSEDELKIIEDLGSRLIQTFWKFRVNLVVVSDDELQGLGPRFESARCQFVTFDSLLKLIDRNSGT